MKKILIPILFAIGCFLVSCGSPVKKEKQAALVAWMSPSDKLKVLSTTAMIDDLIKEIGGEDILHSALIQGELDPHSYELVKGDNEKISCADLIFYNGLELEHGASLKYLLEHHPKAFPLGNEIVKNCPKDLIFLEGQVDPHIWMDVSLFASLIDPIVEKLSRADPQHSERFKQRGSILLNKMLFLDALIEEKMKSIPEKSRYLIASHDAFFYFTRRYLSENNEREDQRKWQQRFAAPEGLAPDGQISTQDIQKIIEHAFHFNIKVVFPESNLNQDGVKKIVSVLQKKGLQAVLAKEPLYGDAMGEKGSGADSYLKMMEHNASVIEIYLRGAQDEL